MELLNSSSELELWFEEILYPADFTSPFHDEEYVVLLVINRTDISRDEQIQLSDKIVGTRCRYAVCFGYECSSWDDSIDMAHIETHPDFDPPDEEFVMTTWHENEEIEDVVEYFRWNTVFDEFVPKNFLVLFFGSSSELKTRVFASLKNFFSK